MRTPAATFLSLIVLVIPASASKHDVQVQVLSTLEQNVRGVGVGIGPGAGPPVPPGGDVARTSVCPLPYPDGSHNLYECLVQGPTGDELGTVQNRRVEAILTTESGQTYYVVLGCQKRYGWCIPLGSRATYVGHLNDRSKWLENYEHRPGLGFMKITLLPDREKKVTYLIEYAVKVRLIRGTVELQR